MNSMFGRFRSIASGDPTARGVHKGVDWGFGSFRQFLKQSDVPKPGKTWLVLDEHPDSINDGFFVNNPNAAQWGDIPASYHNGACGFSFADGHSEIKKWQSASSKYGVKYFYAGTKPFTIDAGGRRDFEWYRERTGYVDSVSGRAMFGY
jgi:prepilin-type processing-associated H-X9-DG protein